MDVRQRQLKYFVTIVDACSLSKAAERLFVAQPSLSQQIANLESELGTQLLLRSTSGVVPTEAGRALYRHALIVLRQLEDLRHEVMSGAGSVSGPVAVGFPTTVASTLAGPLFEKVQKTHPGVRLRILEGMSGYVSELLADNRLDLALLFRDTETRGIAMQPLFDEDLFVFGQLEPREGVHEQTCALSALHSQPIVAPSGSSSLRVLIERTFAHENVDLNVIADVDSLPTMLAIAASGRACTILPASAMPAPAPAQLQMRRINEPGIRRPASLCWSKSLPSSAATDAVRNMIPELIRELQAAGLWNGITLRY
jgi:LysR family nitrogen assimilation transcriptional regulator